MIFKCSSLGKITDGMKQKDIKIWKGELKNMEGNFRMEFWGVVRLIKL